MSDRFRIIHDAPGLLPKPDRFRPWARSSLGAHDGRSFAEGSVEAVTRDLDELSSGEIAREPFAALTTDGQVSDEVQRLEPPLSL